MSSEDERAFSRRLAGHILDRPRGDPDDDLAVLSRQLLRADEAIAQVRDNWGKAEARFTAQKATATDLLEALKALYHKTIIGTDDERHAALDAAWRAISEAEARS